MIICASGKKIFKLSSHCFDPCTVVLYSNVVCDKFPPLIFFPSPLEAPSAYSFFFSRSLIYASSRRVSFLSPSTGKTIHIPSQDDEKPPSSRRPLPKFYFIFHYIFFLLFSVLDCDLKEGGESRDHTRGSFYSPPQISITKKAKKEFLLPLKLCWDNILTLCGKTGVENRTVFLRHVLLLFERCSSLSSLAPNSPTLKS